MLPAGLRVLSRQNAAFPWGGDSMSAISAVGSVMTQAMMFRPPAGPPPPAPPSGVTGGTDSDGDHDESGVASNASPNGKLVNISA
jgi:hypothetical protein